MKIVSFNREKEFWLTSPDGLGRIKVKANSRVKTYKIMTLICPNCDNPIHDDEALLCLYCGESLQRGIGVFGKLKYSQQKVITAVVVAFLILSFVLLVIF